jgi:hypothetical protein
MRIGTVCSIAVAVLAAVSSESRADEKPARQAQKVYASPREVFDAYREAVDKQDWRTVFLCMTPERREDEVFEAIFSCAMRPDEPEVLAVLKQYGVEEEAVNEEYLKCYQKKHGVDTTKLIAEMKDEAAARRALQNDPEWAGKTPVPAVAGSRMDSGRPSLPPNDEVLLRQVVSMLVTDKAGFVEEADKATIGKDANPPRFTKLEQLSLNRSTATGRTSSTRYHIEGLSGKDVKVGQTVGSTFHFRNLQGGWFIEREEATDPEKAPCVDPTRRSNSRRRLQVNS